MGVEVRYPGLGDVRRLEFRLRPGAWPSRVVVETAPGSGRPAATGTLTLGWEGVRMQFANCATESVGQRRTEEGWVWKVVLVDRRWKWRWAPIEGRYNVPGADGMVEPATERTPRELAALCLAALGEGRVDTSALPNHARPKVEWNLKPAGEALEELCRRMGCRVTLGSDDVVRISQVGRGTAPRGSGIFEGSFRGPAAPGPERVRLECGPSRYQARWKLTPVGLDKDGSLKGIERLSYRPPGGWKIAEPGMFSTFSDEAARRQAARSVWRWYQVESGADGRRQAPGWGPIERMDQVELEDGLLEADEPETPRGGGEPEAKRPRKGQVRGIFYPGHGRSGNTAPGTEYDGGFTLDVKRKLVKFDRPTFRLVDGEPAAAELTLECAFRLKDATTGQWGRFGVERPAPGEGGRWGVWTARKEEWELRTTARYDAAGRLTEVVDNRAELEQAVRQALDAELEGGGVGQGRSGHRGWQRFEPDGLVDEVTWTFDTTEGAATRVAFGGEGREAA